MGKKFADSNLIIAMLEKQHQLNLDNYLSAEQKAIACAFIRLCEDSLYIYIVVGLIRIIIHGKKSLLSQLNYQRLW